MKDTRVVVTGLGAVTPLGNDVNSFWQNLIDGKSGAATITKFDIEKFKTKFACEVKDFDPAKYLEKGEIRICLPNMRSTLVQKLLMIPGWILPHSLLTTSE